MSNGPEILPNDLTLQKAMIADLQSKNAAMSEKIRASDQQIQKQRRRIAKLKARVRDRNSPLAIHRFDGFEVAYREGTKDEEVIGHSFGKDIFFSGVPEYQPAAGDVVVDLGSHIGTFALLAASKVGDGRVYAIEASHESYNLLKINAALNRFETISAHHLAIASEDGEVRLYHDVGNWGHSTVHDYAGSHETVTGMTLARFLDSQEIDTVQFMKMNCEGAEFPIILGAPLGLLRRFETILVLYHCDLWRDNSEQDLVERLSASGFDCEVRNRSDMRGWIIAQRMQTQGEGRQS